MKYFLAAVALTGRLFGADHGPVFGYATPVNSEREISFDSGVFGCIGSIGTQFSSGTGLGYGLTPQITLNAFLPATYGRGNLPESRISSGGEWSAGASWRFLHSVTSVGKRIESTASLALVAPGPQADSGLLASLHRAPGIAATLATGFASRSNYFWTGGGFTRFAEASLSRRPDTASWSAVYGYRPRKLRRGYDQWDFRGFAELTGEHSGGLETGGVVIPGSNTTSVWLGPSILAIYKNVAIEGGIQAPLFRDASLSLYGRERFRFALNLSYLKYSSNMNSHPKASLMKNIIISIVFASFALTAKAEYRQVNLVVFGMDCAPCAHAIRVSMKGIQGVGDVAVDLNTGLVAIKLASENHAEMRQFNQAVEKNGFTHKDANVVARGQLSGTATAPTIDITGTGDQFLLVPAAETSDVSRLLGKRVIVEGVLPQSAKGESGDHPSL